MGLLLKNLVKKSLTLKEFHIFFQSTPIEILNFYGLSEEFFFGTDIKCNRPLRWALPVFTLQRKHFELIASACASQCNQMQANTSICSPDVNAEKFWLCLHVYSFMGDKDVCTVFVPILWLASLPKARLKEQSTVVHCVSTTLLIITRKTQGK